MKKSESKKVSRSRVNASQTAQPSENLKEDKRINRLALNDSMSLTLGAGMKKILDFKVRF